MAEAYFFHYLHSLPLDIKEQALFYDVSLSSSLKFVPYKPCVLLFSSPET